MRRNSSDPGELNTVDMEALLSCSGNIQKREEKKKWYFQLLLCFSEIVFHVTWYFKKRCRSQKSLFGIVTLLNSFLVSLGHCVNIDYYIYFLAYIKKIMIF